MPELPEVEAARSLIKSCLVGSRIEDVFSIESGSGPRHGQFDDLVHENSAEEFENALKNRRLLGVHRKGKQIWLDLGKPSEMDADHVDACVLIHFGMTGMLVLHGRPAATYKEFKIHDESWPPKFCKFELRFSNGARLAYCDPRRIGRVRVRGPAAALELPISKLARDPLTDGLDLPSMLDSMRAGGACSQLEVKAALLSQELLFSGIGNWLADEVLYQSHIHPKTRCCALDADKVEVLGKAIIRVCTTASACTVAGEEFPSDYLFHYRWEKSKKGRKKGESGDGEDALGGRKEETSRGAKDAFGNAISFETVGGRTSAVVPAVQRVLQPPASAPAGVKKKRKSVLDIPAAAASTSSHFDEAPAAPAAAAPAAAAAARPAKKAR
jgi:formamidopyrimidine-DNA glycosylase